MYESYLQLSNQTKENRFPKIFARAKELKPDAKRILSFGCSTGEECFTLAETFPEAEIVGIDISNYSIQKARADNKFKDRVFFHDEIGATGKYDLVTSLMVLFCMSQPISQEKWTETIEKIDTHVNNNGVWAIYMSQFPLTTAEKVAKNYEAIKQWKRIHPRDKKVYYCGYYRKHV